MIINNSSKHSFKFFLHPRVFLFILLGVMIMLLTFFTDNNALEIAISGMASIFIGIGVNNLSSLEAHFKDEARLKAKIGHSVKILEMTKSKIRKLYTDGLQKKQCDVLHELEEIEQFLGVYIDIMKIENSLGQE